MLHKASVISTIFSIKKPMPRHNLVTGILTLCKEKGSGGGTLWHLPFVEAFIGAFYQLLYLAEILHIPLTSLHCV